MTSPLFTHSPYQVTSTEQGYAFTTDLGERYLIYFSDASGYFDGLDFAHHALMVGLARRSGGDPLQHDPRILATLMQSLEASLQDVKRVLVYVCDQSDGKQEYRHKLFGLWFQRHNAGRFVRHVVAAANGLYASVIYSKSNPFTVELEESLPELTNKINQS